MALSPTTKKTIPSQENLLLDYVRRLEQQEEARKVAHLHLSSLKSHNRRKNHIRAASDAFEGMVKDMQGQLFVLKNSDLFFIFKDEATPQAETTVQKVRYMFSDDPFLDEERGDRDFCTWYDAKENFGAILQLAQSLVQEETERQAVQNRKMDTRAALKVKQEKGEPLTPEVLGRVEDALSRADLSNLVRRQFVCSLGGEMVPDPKFSELFISIPDLRETLLPGVNLTANPWLFQHLTETLDKRMLAMLVKTDTLTISGDISFNLNVATLLAQDFLDFDDNIAAGRRGSMILEIQKVDIFADLSGFLFARDFVQEKGYRVCIDGMSYDTMTMVDHARLGADVVKIIWSPEMVDTGVKMEKHLREMVDKIGTSKIVLCRVDNREAVDFGQSVGISMFQGRHIESLIAEDVRRRDLLKLKRRIERSETE
jgi:hypothetical protein